MCKITCEETIQENVAFQLVSDEVQEQRVVEDMETFILADYESICYECGTILNLHNIHNEDYCQDCVNRILSNGY